MELAQREAALTIQAEVRDWMRTKHAASVIQRNVRSWLDQQEPDGAVETAMELSMRQQESRVAMLTGAPKLAAASSTAAKALATEDIGGTAEELHLQRENPSLVHNSHALRQ